ncbi:hypothetical protein TWF694_005473 [Orbilia ellipsospora]|uniref:DUF7932 domain-containing protein n=1 Tax=Orbilia ellipsospora TaxID=2528407 RepID=A0AAV9WT98_9PEZI
MERVNYLPGTDSLYHGIVDSSGLNGRDGSNGQNGMPGGGGAPGSPGTNATPATHGENAQQMRVQLVRKYYHGGTRIQAHTLTPTHTPPVQEWLLQAQDMILLKAKGGDGGRGGRGGNGGSGGRGMDGVSRNDYQSGTRGGGGGAGGNGGNGTSGGSGGSGAYIEIEVEEDDMDLLVPIHWDVRGGKGGVAGANGSGGKGGAGGYGGKGYGPRGISGAPGNAIIQPGQHGLPGSARIQVRMKPTRELGAEHKFYLRRYFFTLVDFDVVDENEDGIFEPGEHIYVKNIRIQNTGGMPTPTQTSIPIQLVGTDWLGIYEGEAVFIPPGIPAGETVTINGRLRARIKYPPEPWSREFKEKTQVEFHAVLPSLNGRIIRDFAGIRDITLSYPISITSIRWANSVLPGTKMTMLWVITNKSTRPLGQSSDQARSVELFFRGHRDPTGEEDFSVTDAIDLQKMVEIDYLAPGDSKTYTQDVVFHDNAKAYKHHDFDLTLYLGRPRNPQKDTVQFSPILVQIGHPYLYQPTASFLVIANCNTTENQIVIQHQMLTSLHTDACYDVWNVSLYGGYLLPTDGSNVLNRYFGKGVIILGEDFDYFQQGGVRNAADLMPPEMGFALATHGTNIVFLGERNASIDAWIKSVVYPQFGSDPLLYQNKKQMVLGLRSGGLHNHSAIVPISASTQSKTKGTFQKRAKKTAKLMKTKFPLERFQIYPAPQDKNTVIVRQSLPVRCRLMVCRGPAHSRSSIDTLHLLAVISSLPITARVQLFLKMLGPDVSFEGASTGAVANHLIPVVVKLSIIHELELEISRYLKDAPWPHRISTATTCNVHLKSFHEFIGAWPLGPVAEGSMNFISDIFCHVLHATQLSSFGEKVIRFGFRRTNLRKYILAKAHGFLTTRMSNGPEVMKSLHIKNFTDTTTKLCNHLQVPLNDISPRWIDSFHEENKVLDVGEAAAERAHHAQRITRLHTDNAASQYVLRELVAPAPRIAS